MGDEQIEGMRFRFDEDLDRHTSDLSRFGCIIR
jgi:hypothetical protein